MTAAPDLAPETVDEMRRLYFGLIRAGLSTITAGTETAAKHAPHLSPFDVIDLIEPSFSAPKRARPRVYLDAEAGPDPDVIRPRGWR